MPRPIYVELANPVGRGGVNQSEDVLVVKERLKQLGFTVTAGDTVDDLTIHVIRLFQAIKNGHPRVNLPVNDGLVEPGRDTHKWLNATNAPTWHRLPAGSPDEGYRNTDVTEQRESSRGFGTSWLAGFLADAGAHYASDFLATNPDRALLTVGSAIRDAGHETRMGCDLRLPRTDGSAPGTTTTDSRLYDRDAMRSMLQSLRAQSMFGLAYLNDSELIAEGLCTPHPGHDNRARVEINPPTRVDGERPDPESDTPFARCINDTGEDLAVYGPKPDGSTSPLDVALYRLQTGAQTPDAWRFLGVFVPTDRVGRRFFFGEAPPRRAVLYFPPLRVWVSKTEDGKLDLPVDDGVFAEGEIDFPFPEIDQAGVSGLDLVPGQEQAEQILYGTAVNQSSEPCAVYGPKLVGETLSFDNKLQRLPPFRETPPGWDCDGVFIPSDRIARYPIGSEETGPVALKYFGPCTFTLRGEGDSYSLPIHHGKFKKGEVNWDIPDSDASAIAALPEVPGHHPARPRGHGRCVNRTGEPIFVYGPRRDDEASGEHNSIYRLDPGRETPADWDCDGIYLPSGEKAEQWLGGEIIGPMAIKYGNGANTNIEQIGKRFQLPANLGVFAPSEHCRTGNTEYPDWFLGLPTHGWPLCVSWPIPDRTQAEALNRYPPVPGQQVTASLPGGSGSERIDALLRQDEGAVPIAPGDADKVAVGVLQDLLRGHGKTRLPNFRHSSYGKFGPQTRRGLLEFCRKHGVPIDRAKPRVDRVVLAALLEEPAVTPCLSRAYLQLVLNLSWTPWIQILHVVCVHETGGRFDLLNKNTDGAGLSFGIIQWAQNPERLNEILSTFQASQPALYQSVFGGKEIAAKLLEHTLGSGTVGTGEQERTFRGGVIDSKQSYPRDEWGKSVDPTFELTDPVWLARFKTAARKRSLQKVQIQTALAAFAKQYASISKDMPRIKSVRGVAFAIDLGNQHGVGGARSVYRDVTQPGQSEAELLQRMADKSVGILEGKYGNDSNEARATRERREFFRTYEGLSEEPFDGSAGVK